MATSERDTTVANIIWGQLSTYTKMACGARNAVADVDALIFKIGGRLKKIKVTLTPEDLYDIELFQGFNLLHTYEGIHVENLNECVYALANKSPKEW